MNPRYIILYRSEQYNCQMNELMFQAGVKGMSERSELIPCIVIASYFLYDINIANCTVWLSRR